MTELFVVTGSSKGVGLEICRLLLKKANRVIGLSRTSGPLIESDGFEWCACDLSETDLVRSAAKRVGVMVDQQLDGLIFNAASGYYGKVLKMGSDVLERMVYQNFTNQALLFKLLAPLFNEKTELFYVSTSASRIPAPMMAVYAATKAAFESFIQSAAMELDLKLHIVRPAEIDTSFSQVVGVPSEIGNNVYKLSPLKVAKDTLHMRGTGRIFRNVGHRAVLIDLAVRIWPSILFKRPSNYFKKR